MKLHRKMFCNIKTAALAIWIVVALFLFFKDFGVTPEETIKVERPLRNSTAVSDAPTGTVPSKITKDLTRILDPVNGIVAHETMISLHHGVYAVLAPLADGSGSFVKFAFKTECRPHSKWHGQQGWTEVAVYHFQELFYRNNSIPFPRAGFARGVIVAVTPNQLMNVVHRDKCGVLDNTSALEKALGRKVLRGAERNNNQGNKYSTVLLIGIALEWQDEYDDDHFPEVGKYAPYFTVPPPTESPRGVSRYEILQMSDVFVFDYLMLNPDRLDKKNWFLDKATRSKTALLDNGWAFAGDKYTSSLCLVKSPMLECPSLMAYWSTGRAHKERWGCASYKGKNFASVMEWCRFRPETLVALNRTRGEWNDETRIGGMLSSTWLDTLRSDVLMTFLLHEFDAKVEVHGAKRRLYSTALGRFVHHCPPLSMHDKDFSSRNLRVLDLMGFLESGIHARMGALADHAEECLRKYGQSYVYGQDIN